MLGIEKFTVAVAALSFCVSAVAAVSSSATFSNFTITVVDLAPDDGIESVFKFETDQNLVFTTDIIQTYPPEEALYGTYNHEMFASDAQSVSTSLATSMVQVVAGANDASFSVSGSADSLPAGAASSDYNWYRSSIYTDISPSNSFLRFSLTPNSAVYFSGFAELSAYSGGFGSSNALVYMEYCADDGEGTGNEYCYWTDVAVGVNSIGSAHASQSLFLSYGNVTNQTLHGFFDLTIDTFGVVDALPVPEPGSGAMLMAGLCGIAAASRRGRLWRRQCME